MRSLGTLVALVVMLAATPAGAQPAAAIEKGSSVKIEYTLKDDMGAVLDTNAARRRWPSRRARSRSSQAWTRRSWA